MRVLNSVLLVTVMVVAGLMMVFTVVLLVIVPKGFIPTDDTGMMSCTI